MSLLVNEHQIEASADFASLAWHDAPDMDGLGAAVDKIQAFKVRTQEELATVLEYARDRRFLVRPAGAVTSSKAFVAPSPAFMKAHSKEGIVLVGFDGTGEFGNIRVDSSRREVTVGAAVTLRDLQAAVTRDSYSREFAGPRLENLLKITTLDAHAVATAMGSGGVSDRGDSGMNLMRYGRFMDGRGVVHDESYNYLSYFDHTSSSFARVNPERIGKEMSGRGGPFGIGLEATFHLGAAPLSVTTAVIPLYGSNDQVREALAQLTLSVNRRNRDLIREQDNMECMSLELMDENALAVAKEGMHGEAPFHFSTSGDPRMVVVADFAQFDRFGEGFSAWNQEDATVALYESGLLPEAFLDDVFLAPGQEAAAKIHHFRLMGPEHIRSKLKALKLEGKSVASESTDFAVDPTNEELVQWYFQKFFEIHDADQAAVAVQATYGHLLRRLDLHHRVVMERVPLSRHSTRVTKWGEEVVARQKEGQKVRVRGEKVELPFGRDLELIGKLRDGAHRDANVRLLNRIDPSGLFMDRAPERWGGRWDY